MKKKKLSIIALGIIVFVLFVIYFLYTANEKPNETNKQTVTESIAEIQITTDRDTLVGFFKELGVSPSGEVVEEIVAAYPQADEAGKTRLSSLLGQIRAPQALDALTLLTRETDVDDLFSSAVFAMHNLDSREARHALLQSTIDNNLPQDPPDRALQIVSGIARDFVFEDHEDELIAFLEEHPKTDSIARLVANIAATLESNDVALSVLNACLLNASAQDLRDSISADITKRTQF